MKKSYFFILLLAIAFATNPNQGDFENKANKLFKEAVNEQAERGNLGAKIAQFIGASGAGKWVLSVDRTNLFFFSYGTIKSNLDQQELGLLLGLFGQVFLIQTEDLDFSGE